jgi:hypothetical protein
MKNYKKILVELKKDTADKDIKPLLQELVDSGDVSRMLLVQRVAPSPVTAIDWPLRSEDVLAADGEKKREASRYLTWFESGIRWHKVAHSKRVVFDLSTQALADLAEKEGYDLAILPVSQKKGFHSWFWHRIAGRFEKAGVIPVAVFTKPAHHAA